MSSFNYITNTTQLNKELGNILEKVIESVSNTLLKDFQQHLDATIYAAPAGGYYRNREKGGFYAGWEIKDNQSSMIKGYIRTLAFNGGKLVAPSDYNDLAHGGYNGRDIRGIMDEVLNDISSNIYYSYAEGAKYLSEMHANKGYWDTYLQDIDTKIEKWLNNEFKKYGIVRR